MPPSTPPPVLRTSRLLLRPFELSDAKDVQRIAGDRTIADTTLNVPHPYEDGMAEAWIATHQAEFEARRLCAYAMVLAATGELIGAVSLRITSHLNHAELGYWVGVPWWNRGYCTEAARVLVDYGFSVLGLHRIHSSHYSRNPASGRVMIKLGMQHEGRLREHVKRWDRYEDLEYYGILAREWVGVRQAAQ